MDKEISDEQLDREDWPNARIAVSHWKSAADSKHLADLPQEVVLI